METTTKRLVASTIILAAVAVAGCVFPAYQSVAASAPRIGSSRLVIQHAWRVDRSAPCPKGPSATCAYSVLYQKWLMITVQFVRNQVVEFDVQFDPDKYLGNGPSPGPVAYWRFLTALLPSGARRKMCKTISKTGGLEGPAYACIYSFRGKPILVAHYLTISGALDVGRVALNEDFNWIAAGR